MNMLFKDAVLEEICTNYQKCRRHYSERFSIYLTGCLNAIMSADNIEELCRNLVYQCHRIVNKRNKKKDSDEYVMTIQKTIYLKFKHNRTSNTVTILGIEKNLEIER